MFAARVQYTLFKRQNTKFKVPTVTLWKIWWCFPISGNEGLWRNESSRTSAVQSMIPIGVLLQN